MRILITGPSLSDQGGVANYYNSILPILRERSDFDIHYLEIGSTKRSYGALHPLADQIRFRQSLNYLNPLLVHVNPSLDLKSYLRDGMFVYQAKRRGLPVVVFFRGWLHKFETSVERMLMWFFRKTYLKADAFIVLGSAFREKLRTWGVTAPIILGTTTISDSFMHEFSIAEKVKLLDKEPVFKILFLARLEWEKGVLETMEAMSILRKRGRAVSLTVAGDGRAMGDVLKYAESHKELDGDLHITGDVRGEQKKMLLTTHHIYCLPTYREGMPNSVLEAMAFGMPVVTCPVGGIGDFFENGKMGYLLEERTGLHVADTLENLINDRGAIKDMSVFNHQYAMQNFLATSVADKLLDVYRQIIEVKKK
jgi:glycosyltransferase involved in cell wall biosynthesis